MSGERTLLWWCEYPEFNDPACYPGHPDPKPEDARVPRKHTECRWVVLVETVDKKADLDFLAAWLRDAGFLVSKNPVGPFYVIENDLIGGYDISEHNMPVSEMDYQKGQVSLGTFMDVDFAHLIVTLLNKEAAR